MSSTAWLASDAWVSSRIWQSTPVQRMHTPGHIVYLLIYELVAPATFGRADRPVSAAQLSFRIARPS